jgi:osomolarity two-component system response regulator SSK1
MAQSALGITNSADSNLPSWATLRTFLQPTPLEPGWSNDAGDNDQTEPALFDREDARNIPMPLPRLSRAFSMPLPSQLGHLRRPERPSHSAKTAFASPASSAANPNSDELAIELADSVQMAIQTLLQISPPHILDPAKEQLSGCALQIPTPSISALFTSMKMLNYLARRIAPFTPTSSDGSPLIPEDEFDVGELLQSVGDALSGVAAEAGVDLVIFHSDPSLKDLTIRADECGLAYALSHVSLNQNHCLSVDLLCLSRLPSKCLHRHREGTCWSSAYACH